MLWRAGPLCVLFPLPRPQRDATPVVDPSVHPLTHRNARGAVPVVAPVVTPPRTGPAAGPRRAGPPPRTPARTTGPSPPWPDARRTRRPTPPVARRGARVGRPPPLAPGRRCPRPRRPRPLFPDSSLSLHTHLAVCQSLTAVRASFPRARRPAKMKEPNVNGSAGGGVRVAGTRLRTRRGRPDRTFLTECDE